MNTPAKIRSKKELREYENSNGRPRLESEVIDIKNLNAYNNDHIDQVMQKRGGAVSPEPGETRQKRPT